MTILARIGVLAVSCLCVAGCWVPEKFDATLHIDKARQFQFTYDGTIAYSSALAAIKTNGALAANEENDMKAEVAKLKNEKGVSTAEYIGRGRMRVKLREEGQAQPGTKFFMDLVKFENAPDGALRIVGPTMSADDKQQLLSSGLQLDGNIRLTTELIVVSHNAAATPWFGGLWGAYKWHLDRKESATPTIVLK